MAYTTQSDLEHAAGGAEKLVDLADWDRDGTADAPELEKAIGTADAWIDSHLRRQPTPPSLPLSPVPDVIRWLSADEAVYILKVRRGMASGEGDRERHEERLAWLRGVADGSIVISPPGSAATGAPDTQLRGPEWDVLRREDLIGSW